MAHSATFPSTWSASAPGKVILFGEHSVVHGKTSVAAAIDLRTTATITLSPIDTEADCISLRIPSLQISCQWPIRDLQSALATSADPPPSPLHHPSSPSPPQPVDPQKVRKCSQPLLTRLSVLAEREVGGGGAVGGPEAIVPGISAFLFLYSQMVGLLPGEVEIDTELPVAAGLGSSAAFCVALSAAFLACSNQISSCSSEVEVGGRRGEGDGAGGRWEGLEEEERRVVNAWAYEGERILHGTPSGVDNTVSCYGTILSFRQGIMTRIPIPPPLRVLLTNTNTPRNTRTLVQNVQNRMGDHPSPMAAALNCMDAIAQEAAEVLGRLGRLEGEEGPSTQQKSTNGECASVTISEKERNTKLEDLMQMNQGLLEAIGVGHPKISQVCATTSKFGLKSKLTGAGGGGCVLSLLPLDMSAERLGLLKESLQGEGFSCWDASIGVEGVRIKKGLNANCYSVLLF